MSSLPLASGVAELRQMRRFLIPMVGILLLGGVFSTETLDALGGYVLVTLASALPMALWIRLGGPGVPVLPAVAAFFYLYFAVPVARENFGDIAATPQDVFRAAATAAGFLFAATMVWWLITREWIRRPRGEIADIVSKAQLRQLIVGGLALGILLQIGVMAGWFVVLGTFFGTVRDVATAVAAVACYMIGYGRARGIIRGQFWAIALGGLCLMVALYWTSLLLVSGMQYVLAATLGYFITSKRIPWKMALPVIALMFVLHAGKSEMRDRYWGGQANATISILDVPGVFAEWLGDGAQAIISGESRQDLFDRASLLYRVIFVQQLTPAFIPYLDGESYSYLGDFLIPRFLDPYKADSQAAMVLLNIRYGIQTAKSAQTTAIGWGIVAEAYANFGDVGVLVSGLLFGVLAALFTCWSAGAPPLAMSTLTAVAALATMTAVEMDFTYLLVNLWHALAAMLIFFVPVKFLSGRPKQSLTRVAPPPYRPAE